MLSGGLLLALVLRNCLLEASYFCLHTRLLVGAAELSEWSVLISGSTCHADSSDHTSSSIPESMRTMGDVLQRPYSPRNRESCPQWTRNFENFTFLEDIKQIASNAWKLQVGLEAHQPAEADMGQLETE